MLAQFGGEYILKVHVSSYKQQFLNNHKQKSNGERSDDLGGLSMKSGIPIKYWGKCSFKKLKILHGNK